MVEEILVRGMVRFLALDLNRLSDCNPDVIFWDEYREWQDHNKGCLVTLWSGHENEYSVHVIDELLEVLQIGWNNFRTMKVSHLASLCQSNEKLQPHCFSRAA
jgi:hypothetical protein